MALLLGGLASYADTTSGSRRIRKEIRIEKNVQVGNKCKAKHITNKGGANTKKKPTYSSKKVSGSQSSSNPVNPW